MHHFALLLRKGTSKTSYDRSYFYNIVMKHSLFA